MREVRSTIALILGAALLFWVVVGILNRKPVLTATVSMLPSGETSVELLPDNWDSVSLVQLLLCYGAKLRWLLNNEPTPLTDALRELTAEALDVWSAEEVDDLLAHMPSARRIQEETEAVYWAAEGGERFVVRLYRRRDGSAYVTNDLPRPGMVANLAWHFLVFMNAIRLRLPSADRYWSQLALQAWWDDVFAKAGKDRSLAGQRVLNGVANDAVARAMKVSR